MFSAFLHKFSIDKLCELRFLFKLKVNVWLFPFLFINSLCFMPSSPMISLSDKLFWAASFFWGSVSRLYSVFKLFYSLVAVSRDNVDKFKRSSTTLDGRPITHQDVCTLGVLTWTYSNSGSDRTSFHSPSVTLYGSEFWLRLRAVQANVAYLSGKSFSLLTLNFFSSAPGAARLSTVLYYKFGFRGVWLSTKAWQSNVWQWTASKSKVRILTLRIFKEYGF